MKENAEKSMRERVNWDLGVGGASTNERAWLSGVALARPVYVICKATIAYIPEIARC